MNRICSRLLALTAAIMISTPPICAAASAHGKLETLQGGPYRLQARIFLGRPLSEHPVLLVVLHGDLATDYAYSFASRAAERRDVIAAAILRPGYSDSQGDVSEGIKGLTTGDNYNMTNTDAVAAAIMALRRKFHARKVVLAGHSGGAAISANILGRHPDIVDAALLVSCPCDVSAWRAHMFEKTHYTGFEGTIDTLSPIDLVAHLSDQAEVTLLVGSNDDVAPPSISKSYLAAGAQLRKHIELKVIPGAVHNMLLEPVVQTYLEPLLR